MLDEDVRAFEVPSPRYLVHLRAPGWNVIGLTRPWLPGVAAGHNEQIAWAPLPVAADTQDVDQEPISEGRRIAREPVVVKGRRAPFVFDVERTPRGLVIASDRERGMAFVLRWSGTGPGAAAELGALAIDRALTWTEFRTAATRWKMPVARFVYADTSGLTAFQEAGLIPLRRGGNWVGWQDVDAMPHAASAGGSWTAAAAQVRTAGGEQRQVVFASVLGVTAAARQRFDAGPFAAPDGDDCPVRLQLVVRNWDESRAVNAPGQSESPASRHRADDVEAWSKGTLTPLPFSDAAVQAAARETLMLVPKRPAT